MKATLEISALADAAKHVLRAADAHAPYIRLHAEGEAVTLSAYDGMARSTAVVAALVDEPGDLALNGAWLSALAGATRPGEAEIMEAGGELSVRGGDGRLTMRVASDLACAPDLPEPQAWADVDGGAWASFVRAVAPMAAVKGSRPVLNAVRLTCTDGVLRAEATDRYKLSVRYMKAEGLPDGEWLVNAQWLLGVRDATAIGVTSSMFHVRGDGFMDGMALTDGQYPNTARLWWDLTRDADVEVDVDRAELLDAVDALSRLAFGVKADAAVALRLTRRADDMLRVAFDMKTEEADGTGGYRMVPASVGGDVNVRANARLLSALLKAWDCERVRLRLCSDVKTVVVRRDDEPDAGLSFVPMTNL